MTKLWFDILDVFKPGEELSFKDVTERTKLNRASVSRALKQLADYGLLIRTGERGKYKYKLNLEHPYIVVANGIFRKKEKELFRR